MAQISLPSLRLNLAPLASGERLPVIDELRGVALLLVLCYHGGGVLGVPNVLHGEIGVDIFLMISGCMLALTATGLPAREFFRRRFLRIFPAYWLALALFLWMHARFLSRTYPAADVALHLPGLHGFGPIDSFVSINDSFWFIAMIVPAYLVFFLLRRRLDDFSLVVAVGAVLTTLACVGYWEWGHFGGLIHVGLRIPSFFLGLLAGRLFATGTLEVRADFRLGLALLCFSYLILLRKVHFTTLLPAASVIVLWIALRPVLARAAAGRRGLAALGGLGLISYEVYLFHQPLIREYNLLVQHAWFGALPAGPGPLLAGMLVALAVTVGLGMAVHAATTHWFGRRPVAMRPDNLPEKPCYSLWPNRANFLSLPRPKRHSYPMSYSIQHLKETAEIVAKINPADCEKCVAELVGVRARGGRLFILGVGGSAANASHAVNDFRKIAGIECYAPTDNVSELTARTNDDGWASVFVEWLRGSKLNSKDALLILSVGGGNLEKNVSPGFISAIQLAKQVGARVIGIVGKDGGYTATQADACVIVPTVNPNNVTPHSEAFQAVVWHLWVSHPDIKVNQTKWESVVAKK